MKTDHQTAHHMMIAGLGGKGVLLLGQLLARAGSRAYKAVSYFPLYSFQVRGGPSECTVIFSSEEIPSPALDEVEAVIVLEPSMFDLMEQRVRQGGMLFVEAAGLGDRSVRDDIRKIVVDGVEEALRLGDTRAANFVHLGVYVGVLGVLSQAAVEEEMDSTFAHNPKMLSLNKRAFQRGLVIGKTVSREA